MKQVPLVGCSRCKVRWPLGGVVDTVHPDSGKRLPNHPMLMVFCRKAVCYECILKEGLRAVPLTEQLHEELTRRPNRTPPSEIVVTAREAPKPHVVTIQVIDDMTLQTPRIRSRGPSTTTPINPALPSAIATRIKKEIQDEAAIARARREAGINAELAREETADWREGKRILSVPTEVMCAPGYFPRPKSSRWSLTEPVFQRIPMGTATPPYVPMRDDVLNEVFALAENADIEVLLAKEPTIHVQDRLKGLEPEHTQALRRQIKRFQKKKSG